MSALRTLIGDAPGSPELPIDRLHAIWDRGDWAALVSRALLPEWRQAATPPGQLDPLQRLPEGPGVPAGPGVVVGSGGSRGARRWCLQPLRHLEGSAGATAAWLRLQGLNPRDVCHLTPLPLHHLSGLMPWVRARSWGARCVRVPPALLRQPDALAEGLPALPPADDRPRLISLVPTQLQWLLADPAGVRWLQGMAVIWVGGAALLPGQAEAARRHGMRLAPCYGATETAAMVCALPPERFLAGAPGCGAALADVALRLAPGTGAIEVACARLSPGWLQQGRFHRLAAGDGWWRSGDSGRLGPEGLEVLGRLDDAITSGGETVFPGRVDQRLRELAACVALPLADLLLLPTPDPLWGTQLVALVRPADGCGDSIARQALLDGLRHLSERLPAAERPRHWALCPELAPSESGKWERSRWQGWWQRHRPPP
ncbi:o-succinylbenzoate--CoA ligase [Synechococcus sp. RSCCF101]|uniref:AMP-binding protein n=1 Tax=Synechococcus sp. RSCCF101 TaxID=2511069 RepID=UPI001244DE64|nr:AMP-binding protein [Synechococcus sp. RSCCF101]QEY32841.1 o-succinylbenzoate--CoA ligase [Synechococcus sp. RSCCF101]